MILVTGAAGKTGRAVLRALAGRGEPTRALIRRVEQTAAVETAGARDVVVGDLNDPAGWERAVAGVRVVYLICPNVSPHEIEIGRRAIAACRSTGVPRLVYHSVLHPQIEAMPHHWSKLRVEELLLESGLDFTILQPAAYMQNVLVHREAILERGVYPVPYSIETKLGMVDVADVAEAAARVLGESGHERATYELAGDEVLTQSEIAERLSDALGRRVRVEETDRGQWAKQAHERGLSGYAIESLQAMFRYYERHGFWGNGRQLAWLLDREPKRFAEFAARILGSDTLSDRARPETSER